VLVTVSDKKLVVGIACDPTYDKNCDPNGIVGYYYKADVITAGDYAPFGMALVGRKYAVGAGQYRYGFNGQENSDEIAAGLTTAMYWEYDSRIGRRWNMDPVLKVEESAYLCFSGNPIFYSDHNGDDVGGSGKKDPPYKRLEEVIVKCRKKKMTWNDIPTEKIEKPGLLSRSWSQVVNDEHKMTAQAYASGRQQARGVSGVALFDLDDNNTVVIAYYKTDNYLSYFDHTEYEEGIVSFYSVFRRDQFYGGINGMREFSEDQFFALPKSYFSGDVIYMPTPGSAGKGVNGIVRAGARLSKFTALKYGALTVGKAYNQLKGKISGAQVHHIIEQRFADLFTELGKVVTWPSIALTKNEHIMFNTLWRQQIGLKNWKSAALRTDNALRKDVINAAKVVYKDYPEILKYIPLK
jgi:RHS repeat-associated protein